MPGGDGKDLQLAQRQCADEIHVQASLMKSREEFSSELTVETAGMDVKPGAKVSASG
jgi:hypothetical protein